MRTHVRIVASVITANTEYMYEPITGLRVVRRHNTTIKLMYHYLTVITRSRRCQDFEFLVQCTPNSRYHCRSRAFCC